MRSCTECQEMTPLAELTSVLSGHICQSCLQGLAIPDLSASFQRQADAAKSKMCRKCLETKSLEEFSKDRTEKSGRNIYCKECTREANRASKRKALQANLVGTPLIVKTEKYCPGCEETKPAQEFSRNRSAWDGMQHCCKECARERNAAYRERNTEYRNKQDIARQSQWQETSSLLATKTGRWSKEEEEQLIELYETHTTYQCAIILERKYSSVSDKLHLIRKKHLTNQD